MRRMEKLDAAERSADLPELMRQHADYMATVTDFVGSPDAIERALLKGADEIERLRAALDAAASALEATAEWVESEGNHGTAQGIGHDAKKARDSERLLGPESS